jgi:hypothetical protein
MMKSIVVILLLIAFSISADAQIFSKVKGFVRMKSKPVFQQKTPSIVNTQDHSVPYWQGSTYTNFSENGRIKSTLSFDSHGQIRESFSSINLRKTGALSYWRIQISPRRAQPVFVYTIH